MSQYEYAPLDASSNEIRVLKFPCSESRPGVVRCTLHHVSLDDLSPTYQHYLTKSKPLTPATAAWGWLEAFHTGLLGSSVDIASFDVDFWRYRAEDGHDDPVSQNNLTLPENSTAPVPARFNWGDFEAVSYCWGSDLRDKQVVVNDRVVPVTANLEAMLQELQHVPEARSGMGFWIDGLCINQADVQEKNYQVGLMSRIYSQALSTIVWLGPGDEETDRAVDALHGPSGNPCVSSYDHYRDPVTLQKGMRFIAPTHRWGPVFKLWSRQYFKRMWIIQELVSNWNMTMFMCGSQRFSRTDMRGACRWAQTNAGSIAQALQTEGFCSRSTVTIDHDYVWHTANDILSLIELRESEISVDVLLDLTRKAKASDPRDKVYGMLGLLPRDIAEQIVPDYAKSKDEVFRDMATSVLKHCQRLDEVLSWCTLNEDSTQPSWIPDWTLKYERGHMRRLRDRNAGGEGQPQWTLRHNDLHLCSRGIKVDLVELASVSSSSLLPYRAVNGSGQDLYNAKSPFGRYGDGAELAAAVERTLMHNHPRRCTDGDLGDIAWVNWDEFGQTPDMKHLLEIFPGVSHQWQYFDRFRQSNAHFPIFGLTLRHFFRAPGDTDSVLHEADYLSDARDTEDASQPNDVRVLGDGSITHKYNDHHATNVRLAAVALQHRRLITTHAGFLGLAPDEVSIGDVIAVLLGCSYPAVLRPCEDGYRYVGECYVDGLMDGEAVEAANRGECCLEDILIV